MSQSTDLTLSNQDGNAFRTEANLIIAALASGNKGPTAPPYAAAGLPWIDDSTTPWVVKICDGTDWIPQFKIDPTTNLSRLTGQADGDELQGVPTIKQLQNNSPTYNLTTGSSNAYALALTPSIGSYQAGQEFNVKWNFTNTGACTLNVSTVGAKSIKELDGSDPASGRCVNGGQAKLRYDGTNMVLLTGSPAASTVYDMHLQQQTASGTGGGSSTSATWNTAPFNTTVRNTIPSASVGTNTFTLPAGTYDIEAFSAYYGDNGNQVRLYNTTDSAVALLGLTAYGRSSTANGGINCLRGRITIAGTKTFRLEHYTVTGQASSGLGIAITPGTTEVFRDIRVTKVS